MTEPSNYSMDIGLDLRISGLLKELKLAKDPRYGEISDVMEAAELKARHRLEQEAGEVGADDDIATQFLKIAGPIVDASQIARREVVLYLESHHPALYGRLQNSGIDWSLLNEKNP